MQTLAIPSTVDGLKRLLLKHGIHWDSNGPAHGESVCTKLYERLQRGLAELVRDGTIGIRENYAVVYVMRSTEEGIKVLEADHSTSCRTKWHRQIRPAIGVNRRIRKGENPLDVANDVLRLKLGIQSPVGIIEQKLDQSNKEQFIRAPKNAIHGLFTIQYLQFFSYNMPDEYYDPTGYRFGKTGHATETIFEWVPIKELLSEDSPWHTFIP